MSECGRRRCRLAASETQPEPVSIQQRCHGPQHAVSLSRAAAAPRGSPGSNGDVDVFRQSVYLKLMLSNRSQSYPSPPPRLPCSFIPQELLEFMTQWSHCSSASPSIIIVIIRISVRRVWCVFRRPDSSRFPSRLFHRCPWKFVTLR